MKLAESIVQVFIAHGDRSDRKKARLKYLLDAWGLDRFLIEVEKHFGEALKRASTDSFSNPDNTNRWAHVGVHPQAQADTSYVGVVLPVGRLTSDQLRGLARVANRYGSSEIRLTVWQNLLVPNIHNQDIESVRNEISELGLSIDSSSVRAGLVACTGSTGCKFAASNTKGQAMILAQYLEERLKLDQPVNIHITGCHHSCAQHAIGDVGLLATQVAVGEEMVEGYHVLVGGATGSNAQIGRTCFESVPFAEIPSKVESLLRSYLLHRNNIEDFSSFAQRVGVDALRQLSAQCDIGHARMLNLAPSAIAQ